MEHSNGQSPRNQCSQQSNQLAVLLLIFLRIDQIVSLRVVALSLLPVEGSTLATK